MPDIDNPLEKHLFRFAQSKSKDDYVRLLYAFRHTDVLVAQALQNDGELPLFGNGGIAKIPDRFKPDVVFFPNLGKRLIPVFSTPAEIPADFKSGNPVFMHCRDWIRASRRCPNDGVILNPRSKLSFVLTADQIKVLAAFPEDGKPSWR